MSFRRQSLVQKRASEELRAQFASWCKEHASLIAQTGLPTHCFTPENWGDLLEYGYLWEGDTSIDKLTIRQKAALLRLIMTVPRDLTSHAGHLLILALLDAVEKA